MADRLVVPHVHFTHRQELIAIQLRIAHATVVIADQTQVRVQYVQRESTKIRREIICARIVLRVRTQTSLVLLHRTLVAIAQVNQQRPQEAIIKLHVPAHQDGMACTARIVRNVEQTHLAANLEARRAHNVHLDEALRWVAIVLTLVSACRGMMHSVSVMQEAQTFTNSNSPFRLSRAIFKRWDVVSLWTQDFCIVVR